MVVAEPNISISPNRLVLFTKILDEWGSPFRRHKQDAVLLPQKNAHGGRVSSRAANRIRSRIDWLAFFARTPQVSFSRSYREKTNTLAFITLTLPSRQIHTDQTIKHECLNHFLTVLRQKFGVRNYIWKAELQNNDNIHFHIVIDRYIHHSRVRISWNNIIGKLGYVRRYQERMQEVDFDTYCKARAATSPDARTRARMAYSKGLRTDWTDPNSIDVRSVRGIRSLRGYMAKYLVKSLKKANPDKPQSKREQAFGGAIWHCSRMLSRCKGYVTIYSNRAHDFVEQVANQVKTWIGSYDYCTVMSFDPAELPKRFYEQYIAMLQSCVDQATISRLSIM